MEEYYYRGGVNQAEVNNDFNESGNFKRNIKNFLEEQFEAENLVLFIGSGCSTSVVPLMSDTMEKILENNQDVKDIVREYLDNKINDKDDAENNEESENAEEKKLEGFGDIEGLLNWIQSGIFYSKGKRAKLEKLYDEIKKGLIKSMPKTKADYEKDSEEEENSNGKITGVLNCYKALYKAIFDKRKENSKKVSIFTSNYDLFNEFALERNNILYTTGFEQTLERKFDIKEFKYRRVDDTNRYKDRWQPTTKEANLYKLHGSVNWLYDEKGNLYQRDTISNTNSEEENKKIVIYPTMLKHKETTRSPYSELFREFSNCLQKKNTSVIVIGYGFPDEHINNIISQNLKNPDFNLVIFGNIEEKNLKKYYREHKDCNNLHLIGDSKELHHFDSIVNNFLVDKGLENSNE